MQACPCLISCTVFLRCPLPTIQHNDLRRYEDDEEDLEWDEIFNGQVMADKTHVEGDWSQEAVALLKRLAFDHSRRRASASKQSIGDTSQHHSSSSQAGPSTAHGNSSESRSPYPVSDMTAVSLSQPPTNANSYRPHKQARTQTVDTDEAEAHLHQRKSSNPLPFGGSPWQGMPAGPSDNEAEEDAGMDDREEGPSSNQGASMDGVWNGSDGQQVPPNKRRRTQQDSMAFGRVPSRKQRDVPVARYSQVGYITLPQVHASLHSSDQRTSS